MPRCASKTLAGKRCKKAPVEGTDVCPCHTPFQSTECPICLEDILSARMATMLTCNGKYKHMFHTTCLTSWFKQNKITCPSCRDPVPAYQIMRLDPDHFERKAREMLTTAPVYFNVPGVANFQVPRPIGMTERQVIERIMMAAAERYSVL